MSLFLLIVFINCIYVGNEAKFCWFSERFYYSLKKHGITVYNISPVSQNKQNIPSLQSSQGYLTYTYIKGELRRTC